MAVRIESQAEPIPGYKLVERLGGGGFGEVWKCEAPGGLLKAIKFVHGTLQGSQTDAGLVQQELKALSRVKGVRHPYILSLERYDIIDGQLLIVMELADRNFWDRYKECRSQKLPGIPREELLGYMQETSEALDLMNIEYQLQHLDIKPQNLFLVHNHVKVADFGLVKDLQGMMASVTGGITPVYAAPETFDGWISRFCDQYSLAIVYQELLTGQRPFNGTNVGQLIMQHLRSPPNLVSLPAADRAVIGRALAKSPDQRFPTCQDFVRALLGNRSTAPVPARTPASDPGQGNSQTPARSPEETLSRGAVEQARVTGVAQAPQPAEAPAAPPVSEHARWIRVNELTEREEEAQPAVSVLTPQVQPGGVLFPALVIGLGYTGLSVLQRLRSVFHETLGTVDALPNIRWLYVDTDPEAPRLAAAARTTCALNANEMLQTRLSRPSHYLRAPGGRGGLETWLDLKMLYRIPRNPVTTGLRVLGRLAFFDNYRGITTRLSKELETCTNPSTLAEAAKLPGFGLRSLRPRVYVVTSLAGGTGSGMFLDLAYVLRKLLKAQGHASPDIVGLFVLPAVDRSTGQTMALGNTFAALTELNHFSAPETTFWAHYDETEAPLRDAEAPYTRCVLLPLPAKDDGGALQARAGLIANWLYHDLATPLGLSADETRASIPAPSTKAWSFFCQTFGMYRISWPRGAFVRQVARSLCQQLVRDWMSKDSAAVRQPIKGAVAQEWDRLGLGGEFLLTSLQKAYDRTLGKNPETDFAALMEPLAGLEAPGSDLSPVAGILAQLEELVGRPEEGVGSTPGSLLEPLDAAADAIANKFGKKLSLFITSFIEQCGLRLAGAEEAVRQAIRLLEQELQKQDHLAKELAARAANAYARIQSLLANLREGQASKNRRAAASASSLLELVRCYPRWRHESLMFQRLGNVYLSLRGRLSDQLQEINYCRSRLTELLGSFQELFMQASTEEKGRWSCQLFPAGVQNVADAVKQMLDGITPEELSQLDGLVQELLSKEFQGLVTVCLASANQLANVQEAMQREAEGFVEARLLGVNVAEIYASQHANEEDACADLEAAFEEAAPELYSSGAAPGSEICALAAPPGPEGERFRDLARQALPEVEMATTTAGTDDIIFCREVPYLALSDLDQVGPLGYEAYRQIVSLKNFTPHSRIDINEWRAAGSE